MTRGSSGRRILDGRRHCERVPLSAGVDRPWRRGERPYISPGVTWKVQDGDNPPGDKVDLTDTGVTGGEGSWE